MRLFDVLADPQLDPQQADTDGMLLHASFTLWRWGAEWTNIWWSPCGRVKVQRGDCGMTWLVGYRDCFSQLPDIVVLFKPGSLDALILAAARALVDDLATFAAAMSLTEYLRRPALAVTIVGPRTRGGHPGRHTQRQGGGR